MPRKRRRRNNQEDPPRGPWGGLGQPGQRAYIPEGMESFKLLLLNRGWLLVCTLAGLFILISAVLIIGPLVGFAAVLLLCALVSWRLVEMAQDSRALAALIVVAHVGWIFAGWRVVEMYWPPVRCAWPLWSKAVLLLFFAVVEWNLFMSGYRHGYETVDANWSPTIEVRPAHWGPLWPWAHIGEVEEPEPQTVVKTESLPRPVPNSGQRAVSPPQTTSGEYYDRVLSPKQHAIYVKHLLEFAALAPKIGATWRTWKDRGWSYKSNPRKPEQPSWTDTVDTWATFGVVTSRDEKCTTTMLVTDPREAAARLRAILDKESPPHPHPPRCFFCFRGRTWQNRGQTDSETGLRMKMKLHYLSPEEELAIESNVPWESLDSKIRDLVWYANTVEGLATVQSCAGHVHPDEWGGFAVDSAHVAFKCTAGIAQCVLFDFAPEVGISDVSLRYFDDGTFWICVEVEPSERYRLYDLFTLLGAQRPEM